MTPIAQDEHWMREAIALAGQALHVTSPNPRVGCLIVHQGQVLARGVTQAAGQAHAEVTALRDAARRGVQVAGATFYVTLEPCNHHGRTPPCVDAILAAGAARVVVAMQDPNPLVAGQGLARLRAAGVDVHTDVCTEEALALNPGFIARMTRGTPWLWLKSAASMDGRTALPDGTSKWITGTAARRDGQHWRARSCVVLTGIGTVLADDPLLNVRDVTATPRQPVRAVVDSQLRMPPGAQMLDTQLMERSPVWIFTMARTAKEQPEKMARLMDRGARVIALPAHVGQNPGRLHLPSLLQWLGQHEINEVHVEAGATLGGALLQADCVDALLVYLAPRLLGPGREMMDLPALSALDEMLDESNASRQFEFTDIARVGEDVRLCARHPQRWQALLRAVRASN